MTVSSINGIALSGLSAIDGITLSTLNAINGQGTAGSSLNTGIVSFWKFDEASNTNRLDSVSSNTLVDVNTNVLKTTGHIGDAVQMGATGSRELQVADNASLSFTSSFTIAVWVNADSLPAAGNFPAIVNKWDGATDNAYTLIYNGTTSRFLFSVSVDGTNGIDAVANTLGAPSTATWYLIIAHFDDAANEDGIQVNNGTIDTNTVVGTLHDSAFRFEVGRFADLTWFWEGKINALAVWGRALTTGERTELWNGSAGKAWPY